MGRQKEIQVEVNWAMVHNKIETRDGRNQTCTQAVINRGGPGRGGRLETESRTGTAGADSEVQVGTQPRNPEE